MVPPPFHNRRLYFLLWLLDGQSSWRQSNRTCPTRIAHFLAGPHSQPLFAQIPQVTAAPAWAGHNLRLLTHLDPLTLIEVLRLLFWVVSTVVTSPAPHCHRLRYRLLCRPLARGSIWEFSRATTLRSSSNSDESHRPHSWPFEGVCDALREAVLGSGGTRSVPLPCTRRSGSDVMWYSANPILFLICSPSPCSCRRLC